MVRNIRELPTDFLWALGVSLLLHLFLLELGLAFGQLAADRLARVGSLQVSLPAARASPELASVPPGDPEETGGATAGAPEIPVKVVRPPVFRASRETPLPGEGGQRSRQAHQTPLANQDVPVAAERVRYFRRAELTRPPVLLEEPLIDPSGDAGKGALPGEKMSLRLFVSDGGEIDRAEIERSASRPDFENAVIAAFRPLHFLAGEIDGVAVSSQVVFEIYFDSPAQGSSRSSDQARW